VSTFALCNLGCSKNLVDGERMLAFLRQAGHSITDDYAAAEVILVNTCAFIKEAQEEAIQHILDMAQFKKIGACTTLAVCGCFSQRYADTVRTKFPEVDMWVSLDTWEEAFRRHFGARGSAGYKRELTHEYGGQYLKIAEGCSHGCSYCVIPSIRGAYRSRQASAIVEEARWLYEKGTRELILVSQDTSYYGRDIGAGLVSLLERLLRDTAFPWIRMMYLNPHWVDETLIRLVGSEKRLCSYFDIPIQHISDPILKAMRRARPSSAQIRTLIEAIRTHAPGAAIRTSLIVGFPGETDREFGELVRFVGNARFDKLGVFPYSPEDGAPAAKLRGRPRRSTAERRAETIVDMQREISHAILHSRRGRVLPVMIDRVSEDPAYSHEGRTEFDAPEVDGAVFVNSIGAQVGRIAKVTVRESNDYDLFGTVA